MRLKLVPQFLTDSHETLHRSVPWAEDMQVTFFNSGRKCVAMATADMTDCAWCQSKAHFPFVHWNIDNEYIEYTDFDKTVP